jgi:hypothetical protein
VPNILRRLPISEQATTLSVPGGPVLSGKPFQVIFWVSVTAPGLPACPPGARRFPVVLDTGFNDNFLIQQQHFAAWAGLSVQELDALGFLSVYGQRAPLLDADVWVYRNVPGRRDQWTSEPPFRLELDCGVAVAPASLGAPRLPLLGVRALRRNALLFFLDGSQGLAWVRTRRRFWLFGW